MTTGEPFLEDLRLQVVDGARGQHMLVTLMADYWLHEDARVPSSVLVELMSDFGVSASGTRTLLSRLVRYGRLGVTKSGRRSAYYLTDGARKRLRSGLRRIAEFAVVDDSPIPTWTAIAFSVPEGRRADRQKLRTGLLWLGCAALYDGLWITPRNVGEQAKALLNTLGIESASIFTGSIEGIGSNYGSPIDAWDLPAIRRAYEMFLDQSSELVTTMENGGLSPAATLVRRTELMNVWRGFPRLDPSLPRTLLPNDWPRARAQERYIRLYDGLGPAAMHRIREVVEAHDPRYAPFIAGHSIGTRLSTRPG